MDRSIVYGFIDAEREYQIQKWGDVDKRNSVGDFICYMSRYLNNAKDCVNPDESYQVLRQILKVVALGVACLEQHGDKQKPKLKEEFNE